MILHEMFPIVVSEYNLGREFTDEEKESFDSANEMKFNMGNLTSINRHILDLDGLQNLKDTLLEKANQYIHEIYNPSNVITPYVTQSWINYTKHNQWHHKHRHENSFLSGVLYINACRELDNITFFNNHYNQLGLVSENFQKYNSNSWKIPVGSRDILIFPSGLYHMVEPTINKNPRISLSFNIFIRGILGSKENMTELVLE